MKAAKRRYVQRQDLLGHSRGIHVRFRDQDKAGDFFVLDQRGRLSHSTTTQLAQAPTLFNHPTLTCTSTYTYIYTETLYLPALGPSLDA